MRNNNQIPITPILVSRLKIIGFPIGFRKGCFKTIRLGTPIGSVCRDRARFKFVKISIQIDWKLLNNSVDSALSMTGKFVKLCIIGLKNDSTRQIGPNQRNKSSKMGGIIKYGLFAIVLKPDFMAWIIFGFAILLSELVFIQPVILPHSSSEGYKTNNSIIIVGRRLTLIPVVSP